LSCLSEAEGSFSRPCVPRSLFPVCPWRGTQGSAVCLQAPSPVSFPGPRVPFKPFVRGPEVPVFLQLRARPPPRFFFSVPKIPFTPWREPEGPPASLQFGLFRAGLASFPSPARVPPASTFCVSSRFQWTLQFSSPNGGAQPSFQPLVSVPPPEFKYPEPGRNPLANFCSQGPRQPALSAPGSPVSLLQCRTDFEVSKFLQNTVSNLWPQTLLKNLKTPRPVILWGAKGWTTDCRLPPSGGGRSPF